MTARAQLPTTDSRAGFRSLAESEVAQNCQDNHNDANNVEHVVHGFLLFRARASAHVLSRVALLPGGASAMPDRRRLYLLRLAARQPTGLDRPRPFHEAITVSS